MADFTFEKKMNLEYLEKHKYLLDFKDLRIVGNFLSLMNGARILNWWPPCPFFCTTCQNLPSPPKTIYEGDGHGQLKDEIVSGSMKNSAEEVLVVLVMWDPLSTNYDDKG